MAKNVTLKDLIDDLDPEIRKLLYEQTRSELNKRPHVLDISYKSLLVNKTDNYTDKEFKDLHDTLLKVVDEKATRKFTSINAPEVKANFASNTPYLVYINDGPSIQLLMAKSYDAIGTFMTTVSKDQRLIDSIYGQRIKSKKEVLDGKKRPTGEYKIEYERASQLGHIGSEGDIYFTNPLIYKLGGLLDFASISGNRLLEQYVTESLNDLYSIQANIDYSFKNSAPEVLSGVESILGEAYIVVTLQTYDKNQEFSRAETKIFDELVRKIANLASAELRKRFFGISGSNTLLEDIAEGLANTIRFGKAKLKSHRTQKSKTSKQSINKPAKLPKNKGIVVKVPKPKTTIKLPSNLTNLQNLLNARLVDQVKQNMGNGTRSDVLNLQTGRFAESVEVTRLSESRQGMITAFYTYMKNPYATFSAGGRQEFPRSRDPKTLISRSIREIAAEQVRNRLRSVLV